jgi:hypothetical protein
MEATLQQVDYVGSKQHSDSIYSMDDMEFEERMSIDYRANKAATHTARTTSKPSQSERTTSMASVKLEGYSSSSSNADGRKSMSVVTKSDAYGDSKSNDKSNNGCCCTWSDHQATSNCKLLITCIISMY